MRRSLLHVLALLFVAAGSLHFMQVCGASPMGRRQVVIVPDEQMNEMGVKAFEELKGKTAIERDPAVNAYVRCVTDALLARTRESGKYQDGTGVGSWEIVVFRDPAVNAFALPGGKIGVFTGLFQAARNQHQLAAVIGHEIAHVIARHGNERVSQSNLVEVVAKGVAGMLGGEYKEQLMGALGVGAQYGVILPFSREHESEADLIGQEMMALSGFEPAEAAMLWENMRQLSGGSRQPQIMSTHPSSGTRINELRGHLSTSLPMYVQATEVYNRRPACAR